MNTIKDILHPGEDAAWEKKASLLGDAKDLSRGILGD